MEIKKYLNSFKSILIINLIFFFLNLKIKSILFFHPVDNLKNIHEFYLKKLSNYLGENFIIVNCHKSLNELTTNNQFYISYHSLKFIFFCNILFQ